MDWTKEISNINFCGYCTGSPPDATCNGTCFTDHVKHPLLNKSTHLKSKIEYYKNKISDLRKEMKIVDEAINSTYGKNKNLKSV